MKYTTIVKPDSSAIARFHHNKINKRLVVEFVSGGKYAYRKVSRATYEAFKDSPSKGKFYHAGIKGQYEVVKLTK